MKRLNLFILLFSFSLALNAQYLGTRPGDQSPQQTVNNLTSIEGITNQMLALISGDQNKARDWEAFRNLFLPTAQFIALDPNAKNGEFARAYSLEEFIRMIGPIYARDGFMEQATGLKVFEFNGVANVFQSFEAKNMTGTYRASGINSYQLVYHSNRWWITSTTWANETDTLKVPEEYKTQGNAPATGNPPSTNTNGNSTNPPKKGKIILKKR